MSGRSSSTSSASLRVVRAAPASPSARWTRVSSSPTCDGYPWNAVVEHRPQAVGTCQRRADILRPRLVERDTCRRDVHDRARRVVAEARLFDERFCRPCALPCLGPGSFLGREERELRLCQEDLFEAAEGQPPLDGCQERPPLRDRSHRAGRAQRLGRGVRSGSRNCPARADPAPRRRRRAPARHRSASCARAASRPTARSWRCRPRAGSSRLPRRRERASARPPRLAPSAHATRLQRRRARGTAQARRRRTTRATPPGSPCGRRSRAAD